MARLIFLLLLAGCSSQSWDQEHLKAHDGPGLCRKGTMPYYTTWPDQVPIFLECR